MSKALVTFGVGKHAECLEISRPMFLRYAERHGYDYLELGQVDETRPPSWSKVVALQNALGSYDEALWCDSDVVIVDESLDLAAQVPAGFWQGLVIHRQHLGFQMGEVPSCGVWFARQAMLPVLEQVWAMTEYTNHAWWEQAAMHKLLGYVHNGKRIFPVVRGRETPLRRMTAFVPEEWNCVDFLNQHVKVRFMHMAGLRHDNRLTVMRLWADQVMETRGVGP